MTNGAANRYQDIDGIPVPRFFYGTAWKEDQTQRLTELALKNGFRGIDTANQRRHYHEAGVGAAIAATLASGLVKRADLFLQTKFTFRRGQDHRLPYDPNASVAVQVEQSFARSLEHLGVDTIDSYVLHGPTSRIGLADDDWEAWRAMEQIHGSGRARLLGVSNVSADQIQHLCAKCARAAEFRAEPMLCQRGLGSNRAPGLCGQRDCLPGLLTAHRQPRGIGPAGTHPDRLASSPRRGPDRLSLRPGRWNGAVDRHDE